MILVDAVYINDGGGKVLLDYLVEQLELSSKDVFYLLDKRLEGQVQQIKETNKILYIRSGINKRRKFYTKNRESFSSVLCFGNLAPEVKLNSNVYTYFHQPLFIQIPQSFSIKNKLIYTLKTKVLNYFKKNTDFWFVQSDLIRKNLSKKYKIDINKILILPFYESIISSQEVFRVKNTFLYVSTGNTHKNHIKLIDAFCKFYDMQNQGKLILTVSEKYPELLKFIYEKQKKYPIENLGFISRANLGLVYKSAEFLIYPSLAESFGLGLVEAIENGCKILGADLPYTYAVCEPSLVFNPLDKDDIIKVLVSALQDDIKPSQSKISNNISQILQYLK